MLRIIDFQNRKEWDNIVRSFKEYDIYYLSGYLAAFKIHGDGEPILLYYSSKDLKAMCAFMIRNIAREPWANQISNKHLQDVVTPYGYGGWILDGDESEENKSKFWDEYSLFMKENNIVDAFTRWCPWLKNQEKLRGFSNIIDLSKTVYIDTASSETIFENIKSKDRSTIRKAIKNGITIEHSHDPEKLEDFRNIYNATMRKDNAIDYYYFEPEFYDSIAKDLKGNWELFYAMYKGRMIAASIMLLCNGRIHYHLSGSVYEYRHLNPTNLILYETALYGVKHGYKLFHLGGGVGSKEDPLYKFKKSFNKYGDLQFSISKDCFDINTYNELVELRKHNDPSVQLDSGFFPSYRTQN